MTKNKLHESIYCEHGPKNWQTATEGELASKRLAVKDLFSVKGQKNAAGNPDWYNSHDTATDTAKAISTLMAAGCLFTGFTHTDELAYSLDGNNMHYGVADNPKLPGHTCGGSTMGSAAAVAWDLADIGLGTDTGGSIRIPASYCGLYGIRPTHNVVDTEGLLPLAKPFDTVGWITPTALLLKQVGQTLIPAQTVNQVDTLVVCEPLLDLVAEHLKPTLHASIDKITPLFKQVTDLRLPETSIISELSDAFRILQGRAIAKQHANWINAVNPQFSPAIETRFNMAMALTEKEEQEAKIVQQNWQKIMQDNLSPQSTLFLPTTPTTAPKIGEDTSALRQQILTLTAVAGLTRSVQVHMPLCPLENQQPYGFSLIMLPYNDHSLLRLTHSIASNFT